MRVMYIPLLVAALCCGHAAGQNVRGGTNNAFVSASTPPTTTTTPTPGTSVTAPGAKAPWDSKSTSTLFLSTEPTLVPLGDDSDTTFKLKVDLTLSADQHTFGFNALSGVATHVDPRVFLPGLPDGLKNLKPMSVDFSLHDTNNKLQIGQPGSVEILFSSDYFNAIFGYNYDAPAATATHDHHHDDHPVHEFDAVQIPATFAFEKVVLARAISGADAAEDGAEAIVYLHNVKISVRPRSDHVKGGIGSNLVFRLGEKHPALEIPTRTLVVPEGSIRPGKWLVNPRLFPRWKWGRFELKRRLCVQPVRVAQRRCKFRLPAWLGGFCFWWSNTSVSGRGLAFGQPSANKHWGQVGVTFQWLPWITVIDRTGKYEELTSGAEETDLKNEVDDADCIEVFFVERFSPASRMGGGACWGGGTAGAKIISSDQNVDCGTDITHLAHELGHALNLKHPGSNHPTRPDGSTGTLACPSGWEQDNPRRQSEENGDNAANPLLTSFLSFVGFWNTNLSPDCIDSADCGSCNAHLPNEPCV